MSTSSRSTVLALALLGAACATEGAIEDHAPATTPEFIYGPSGAEWIAYRHDTPPGRSIHIADVDLCAPGIEVRATGPGDGRQVVSQFAAATGALVAINGGHSWDGEPGPSAHDGAFFGLPDAGDLGQFAFGDGLVDVVHMSAEYVPTPAHQEVLTGLLTLVHDGVIQEFGPGYTCDVQHPRTLLGLTADKRRLLLVAVDGRAPGAGRTGMTCAESAWYMASLGAHWALNLDGGGSTEMVLGGQIMNVPSDGSERVVPTHLAVVRTPGVRGHCPTEPPPPPPPAPCGALAPGQSLAPGESVSACGGQVLLAHQTDGNVVLYAADGRALWHTSTNGQATTQLAMQGDGNLVLYGPFGALWSSETSGFPGAYLGVQDDGNAVIYDGGYAIWATHTSAAPPLPPAPPPPPPPTPAAGCGTLTTNAPLAPGDGVFSCDGRFLFAHQGDGNVVLYQDGWPIWDTRTNGHATTSLVLQDDGNLVLYGPMGAVWASGTWGVFAPSLAVQDDGNVVLYAAGAYPVWSTETCCR